MYLEIRHYYKESGKNHTVCGAKVKSHRITTRIENITCDRCLNILKSKQETAND